MADPGSAESRALLEGLLDGRVSSLLEKLQAVEAPRLLPAPAAMRCSKSSSDSSSNSNKLRPLSCSNITSNFSNITSL